MSMGMNRPIREWSQSTSGQWFEDFDIRRYACVRTGLKMTSLEHTVEFNVLHVSIEKMYASHLTMPPGPGVTLIGIHEMCVTDPREPKLSPEPCLPMIVLRVRMHEPWACDMWGCHRPAQAIRWTMLQHDHMHVFMQDHNTERECNKAAK
jgi:hypothetical protein